MSTSTVSGTLDVISNGAIIQAGSLTVAGTSSFDAGANPIILTNASNDFAGAVTATGSGVSITDANSLHLAGINAGTGNVTLTANGGGLVTVGDLSGSNVTLSSAGTIAQTAGTITANTLTGNASGNVLLSSGGNQITNLGAFSANGFSLGSAQPLTVTGAVNSTGALTLSASLVNITNTGSLTFGNSSITGNVTGDYSQTGTLNLHATSSSNDQLAISGTASLGGTLSVAFSSQPSAAQSFTVLTANSIRGTFGTVNVTGLAAGQSANATYNASSVVLTINATTPVTLQSFEVD